MCMCLPGFVWILCHADRTNAVTRPTESKGLSLLFVANCLPPLKSLHRQRLSSSLPQAKGQRVLITAPWGSELRGKAPSQSPTTPTCGCWHWQFCTHRLSMDAEVFKQRREISPVHPLPVASIRTKLYVHPSLRGT